MKYIKLTQGQYAIVDDENYEWLNQWKWYAGSSNDSFYAARRFGKRPYRKIIQMHRLILNAKKDEEVDHINHNRLDNRIKNIRICTRSQNSQNQRPIRGGTSKYKGVHSLPYKRSKKKWRVYIQENGKRKYLGCFCDEEKAAKTYDNEAKILYGEFACLNFPERIL